RASKRDISYCTTWLLEHSWRRVQKRFPDGQTVRVWRAPDWKRDSDSITSKVSESGVTSVEKPSLDPVVDSDAATDMAGVATSLGDVAGRHIHISHPKTSFSRSLNRSKRIPKQQLNSFDSSHTQNLLPWQILKTKFFKGEGIAN